MVAEFWMGVLLGLLACFFAFGWWYNRRLENDNARLRGENSTLKEAQAKRLPHDTVAALEDLLSANLNARRLLDAMESDSNALKYWLDKTGHFGRGARGCEAYDPEQETGNNGRRR